MCELIHVKYLVNQKLSVVKKVYVIVWITSEILQRTLLIPYKFSNEIFRNLNSLNIKLIQCVIYSILCVQSKQNIRKVLQHWTNLFKLKECAYYLKRDVWAPRLIPINTQILKAFYIINMVLNYHIEYPFINIEFLWFCIDSCWLLPILYKLIIHFFDFFQFFNVDI